MGEAGITTIDDRDITGYRHPWLGVEVRHLATLSAVARTGSFRQAAKELGYVQSAISQQVARLERVVGTRLLERQKGQRHVRLTPTGEVLAQRGDRILGELRAARIDLSHTDDGAERPIRLAIASDLSPLLATLLSAMHEELPETAVQVTEVADDDEGVRRLESGTADVALGCPLVAPGLASVVLLQEPFVLLLKAESSLARMTSVSNPRDLAGERLIVPAAVASQAPLHAPGLLLEHALQVPLAATVPPLVAAGHGIGLVPQSVAQQAGTGLTIVPTAGLIAPQRIMLAWHAARRRTDRLAKFCDAAARHFLDSEPTDHAQAA